MDYTWIKSFLIFSRVKVWCTMIKKNKATKQHSLCHPVCACLELISNYTLLLTELVSPSCVNMSISTSCSRIRLLSLTCKGEDNTINIYPKKLQLNLYHGHWHEPGNSRKLTWRRASLTCSGFMELICPDIWFTLPPLLAMTPRFMLLLLLYIPALGWVEYCDWDCCGYTLYGGKLSQHISN